MKKNLLLMLTLVLAAGWSYLNSQTHYGPGEFDTYFEDFEDEEAQGWVGILNSEPTDWTVVDASGVNDQGTLQLNNRAEGGDMISAIYDEATFENYMVSAIIYPGWGNKTGIIFNYQDEDNFYVVEHWANNQNMYIRQKIDGAWDLESGDDPGGYNWQPDSAYFNTEGWSARIDTSVGSDWIEGFGVPNTMQVISKTGGLVSVYFNDTLIFEDIELTALPDSGKVGIYTHWNNVWVDNFEVSWYNPTGNRGPDMETLNAVVYPNPVSGGSFTVDASHLESDLDLRIYSVTGQLVYSGRYRTGRKITLDAESTLGSRGMYILSLSSENRTYTGKISY